MPFAAAIVFIVISVVAPQNFAPALAPLRLALLTAVFAIVALLIERSVHRRPFLTATPGTWLAACLAGWAIVSVAFSYWPGGSVAFLLDTYLKSLAVFWLLGMVVDTPARFRVVAWTLSLASLPLAVTGIKNFLSGAFVLDGAHLPVRRIIGYGAPLTENPNDLALMLNLVLPLSIALLLVHRGRGVRLLLAAVAMIGAGAVILTFSRGGFLTLATTFVMYLWKLRRRTERGLAWAALVVALGCIPLLPSGYFDRLGTIADIQSDPTGSAQARWSDTVAAAHFVLKNPIIGAGVGMNTLALNEERGPAWKVVHNVYLEYAVELGVPGLAMFALLLAWCVRTTTSIQRRSAEVPALRELSYLAEGLQISFIAFAAAAFFHPVAYQLYFYYIAGLAVALKVVYESRSAAVDQNRASRSGRDPRQGEGEEPWTRGPQIARPSASGTERR